ncbi:MAG: hypothetical protein SNJ67_10285 [Chloracidobacterium sp.]|uniref:Uncharacterized protein n=1 Tax=Chloracidobacterium validum TaxID=2821543 RepID=A0ABX8BA88_9BACT|nr:hypothetical protein [Chloracidobacterium validum]QUW03852.1 hypothetical protein J8C06_05340 [Chloracidobacterium validum]
MRFRRHLAFLWFLLAAAAWQPASAQERRRFDDLPSSSRSLEYRLLATSKTSTMEREMNQAAQEGFRFEGVMGGETAFGGNESVVVMSRTEPLDMEYEYKLLATNKTSTMQRELQQAGNSGFEVRGKTIFETVFGGRELVVILERPKSDRIVPVEYKLLATSRTSTMQKELSAAGREGFQFVVMAVAETAFGGREVVVILRRSRRTAF